MCNWMLTTAFLCLFSVSQATLQNCEELTKPLPMEEDTILGKWIFFEGIADHFFLTNILKMVNSSWVSFSPNPLAHTVTMNQGNMLGERCDFQTANATVRNNTLYVVENLPIVNDIFTEGQLLPSCSDCYTVRFISKVRNETVTSLYFFKKEGNVKEADLDMYWKQAECLGFRRERQYSYDGVTELCKLTKDSSPDQKPNLDKPDQ